jgi:hypothetical protein
MAILDMYVYTGFYLFAEWQMEEEQPPVLLKG